MKSKIASLGRFLKRNVYYLLLLLCVAVIITVITVSLTGSESNPVVEVTTPSEDVTYPEADKPAPEDTTIYFDAPVRTGEIGMDYSATEFVFSSTLNQFRVHKGIDFLAEAGTDVYAAYDGTVESVSTDVINGTMVVIKHNDNLKTVYKSLDRDLGVEAGDRVRRGDVIGKVSDSACFEVAEGAHLHFEVMLNGELSDPYVFLLNSEK